MRLDVVIRRGKRTEEQQLDLMPGEIVKLGAAAECHVVFSGDMISPTHAELRVDAGLLVVVNHSINGTRVNGSEVEQAAVRAGDRIQLSESAEVTLKEVHEGRPGDSAPAADTTLQREGPSSSFALNSPLVMAGAALWLVLVAGGAYLMFAGGDAAAGGTGISRATWEKALSANAKHLADADLAKPRPGVVAVPVPAAVGGVVDEPARLYATLVELRGGAGEGGKDVELIVDRISAELDRFMTAAWKAEATQNYQDANWLYRRMAEIVPDPAAPVFRYVQRRLAKLPAKKRKKLRR